MEFDFAELIDDGNKIPEQFRSLYAEADGKYKLRDDDVVKGARAALVGLNGALKAARSENKTLKGTRIDTSALAEFGEDPVAQVNGAAAKIAELQQAIASGTKINPEKIKEDLTVAFSKEKETLVKRNEALTGQLHGLLVDNAATTAIAELKGVPELLLPFVRNQVKVVEADGKLTVNVVDAQGDTRFSTATGQPMSIKELVQSMKADAKFGRLFESEVPQGGGSQPGAQTRNTPQAPGEKTAADKIHAGLQARLRGRVS